MGQAVDVVVVVMVVKARKWRGAWVLGVGREVCCKVERDVVQVRWCRGVWGQSGKEVML